MIEGIKYNKPAYRCHDIAVVVVQVLLESELPRRACEETSADTVLLKRSAL